MKKNAVLWCDSTGKQRRFIAIDSSDAAVNDVSWTAEALHKTGAAQWAIYFGDKGTPIKQWGISPEQVKMIAGVYKPVSHAGNPRPIPTEQNYKPISTVATEDSSELQIV